MRYAVLLMLLLAVPGTLAFHESHNLKRIPQGQAFTVDDLTYSVSDATFVPPTVSSSREDKILRVTLSVTNNGKMPHFLRVPSDVGLRDSRGTRTEQLRQTTGYLGRLRPGETGTFVVKFPVALPREPLYLDLPSYAGGAAIVELGPIEDEGEESCGFRNAMAHGKHDGAEIAILGLDITSFGKRGRLSGIKLFAGKEGPRWGRAQFLIQVSRTQKGSSSVLEQRTLVRNLGLRGRCLTRDVPLMIPLLDMNEPTIISASLIRTRESPVKPITAKVIVTPKRYARP